MVHCPSNGTLTLLLEGHSTSVLPFYSIRNGQSLHKHADTNLSATMALGGATISVDNEMDGDNLETSNQTVGIKGSYGTMSYGLGWEADGDLGFSIGTSLGGIGLTISRVNTGSTYSMGLGATVDLGGGMTLNASNAQNSDGLTDVNFNYANLSGVTSRLYNCSWCKYRKHLQARAVHKSISSVGLSYAGGGTSVAVTYQRKLEQVQLVTT